MNESLIESKHSHTSQICVVEDHGHVFNIDLKKFTVEIDRNGCEMLLVQQTLNG